MSGDNLYGNQPLKFYSENMTLTKIVLIEHYLNYKYSINETIEPENKYIEIQKLIDHQ